MRIRAKISFIAFEQRVTVPELIVAQITRSYRFLMAEKCIPGLTEEEELLNKRTFARLNVGAFRGIIPDLIMYNRRHLKGEFDGHVLARVEQLAREDEKKFDEEGKIKDKPIIDTGARATKRDRDEVAAAGLDGVGDYLRALRSKDTCADVFRDIHALVVDTSKADGEPEVPRDFDKRR